MTSTSRLRLTLKILLTVLANQILVIPDAAIAEALTLYVDKKTKQVFTEPGKGREPLKVKIVTDEPEAPAEVKRSVSTTPAAARVPDSLAAAGGTPKKEWYDRLSVRGYTQFRTTYGDHDGETAFFHPADRTVGPDQSFTIRRGRVILSGDATDHLFVYAQPDLNASPTDGDFSTQLRDLYSDISIDPKKEFRFRVGQSKVPFGFVNMQSSQNRLAMERPDALNSAVEGERDVGAFFYWAPKEIRERFASLVRDGLKGSGDYGVFAFGAYNGQGLNRSDSNDRPHMVSRVSYPFKFDNGQIFEPGLQGYTGLFVPRTREISLDDSEEVFTPSYTKSGIRDERVALSAVLYPQPFGFETEWTVGKGPEISKDYSTIEEKSLYGGYALINYRIKTEAGGDLFPFLRWQTYDGGRKFGRNAPHSRVRELDVGVEFAPWKEVEFSAMYTYSFERANTNDFPYSSVRDASRLGLQVQVNY